MLSTTANDEGPARRRLAPPREKVNRYMFGERGRKTGWKPREGLPVDEMGMEDYKDYFTDEEEEQVEQATTHVRDSTSPAPIRKGDSPHQNVFQKSTLVSRSPVLPSARRMSHGPTQLHNTHRQHHRRETMAPRVVYQHDAYPLPAARSAPVYEDSAHFDDSNQYYEHAPGPVSSRSGVTPSRIQYDPQQPPQQRSLSIRSANPTPRQQQQPTRGFLHDEAQQHQIHQQREQEYLQDALTEKYYSPRKVVTAPRPQPSAMSAPRSQQQQHSRRSIAPNSAYPTTPINTVHNRTTRMEDDGDVYFADQQQHRRQRESFITGQPPPPPSQIRASGAVYQQGGEVPPPKLQLRESYQDEDVTFGDEEEYSFVEEQEQAVVQQRGGGAGVRRSVGGGVARQMYRHEGVDDGGFEGDEVQQQQQTMRRVSSGPSSRVSRGAAGGIPVPILQQMEEEYERPAVEDEDLLDNQVAETEAGGESSRSASSASASARRRVVPIAPKQQQQPSPRTTSVASSSAGSKRHSYVQKPVAQVELEESAIEFADEEEESVISPVLSSASKKVSAAAEVEVGRKNCLVKASTGAVSGVGKHGKSKLSDQAVVLEEDEAPEDDVAESPEPEKTSTKWDDYPALPGDLPPASAKPAATNRTRKPSRVAVAKPVTPAAIASSPILDEHQMQEEDAGSETGMAPIENGYGGYDSDGGAWPEDVEEEEGGDEHIEEARSEGEMGETRQEGVADEEEEGEEEVPLVVKKGKGRPVASKKPEVKPKKAAAPRAKKDWGALVVAQNDSEHIGSKRKRLAPVEYWKGDHVKYEMRRTSMAGCETLVPVATGIFSAPHEDPEPARKKSRPAARTRTVKKEHVAPLASQDVKVMNFATGKEELQRIVYTEDMISPQIVSQNSTFMFQRTFNINSGSGESFCGSGVMVLPKGAEKPNKTSGPTVLILYVISGKVRVTVHSTSFEVGEGAQFLIPRGNQYSMKNTGVSEARLFFLQSKEVAVAVGDEGAVVGESGPAAAGSSDEEDVALVGKGKKAVKKQVTPPVVEKAGKKGKGKAEGKGKRGKVEEGAGGSSSGAGAGRGKKGSKK
ncbi:hypothetical protein HDU98_004382 [Podochytrium sp. JEL0797]|nr:hypothetical protein HDU98_004382 [Podochytrium sp. JEL0797]